MDDYRKIQLQDIDKKITETKSLLDDPSLRELALKEIEDLETQKKALETSINISQKPPKDSLDERNVILEVKGAAGGIEAKLWKDELFRMYVKFATEKEFLV